jgi:hypothetical protein
VSAETPGYGCPESAGMIYHDKETCTDPVVAKLGWYGSPYHRFIRPGQVAPDRPAPDACMQCGQPEAAHERRAGDPGQIAASSIWGVAFDEVMRPFTGTQCNRLLAIIQHQHPAAFLEALHVLDERERLERSAAAAEQPA